MVFSTVAEGERLASAIPTGEKALRLVGAINLLASDYIAVLWSEQADRSRFCISFSVSVRRG